MIIKKQWLTVGIVTVSAIGLFAPPAIVAQHGARTARRRFEPAATRSRAAPGWRNGSTL